MKKIIIEDIKDIEIDGICQRLKYQCMHDITLIYHNELIKSTTLNYSDIKFILNYLNKRHPHFN